MKKLLLAPVEYARAHVVKLAVSANFGIVLMQLFLPAWLDLFFGLIMVGLTYVVARLSRP